MKTIELNAKWGRIMKTPLLGIIIGVAVAAVGLTSYTAMGQAAKPAKRAPSVSFKEDVLPIFKGRCVEPRPWRQGVRAASICRTIPA